MSLLLLACTSPDVLTDAPAEDSASVESRPLDSEPNGDSGDTQDTDDTQDPEVDYRDRGASAVSTRSVSVSTSGSCTLDVTLYEPAGGSDAVVILSHGFARAPANVAGWADHIASHGVTVATPGLCHLSVWDSDHAENANDLEALSAELGFSKTIYAGHSAGGLASAVAASGDASAVAVVGLDLTDADGLAASADLSGLDVYGILGEPSTCNSDGNGSAVYSGHTSFRVTEADHCDFESPTDWVCELGCPGTNNTFDNETITGAIGGLLTSAVVDAAGLGSADAWWKSGGTFHDELAGSGLID